MIDDIRKSMSATATAETGCMHTGCWHNESECGKSAGTRQKAHRARRQSRWDISLFFI